MATTTDPVALRARVRGLPRVGSPGAVALGVLLGMLGVVAVLGPAIAPAGPNDADLSAAFQGPSAAHLLGTDGSGRDLLSRLIVGSRTALIGPLVITLLATAVGTLLALVSAWRGGWVDTVVSRVLDAIFAFPGLVLAILAVAVFGTGLTAPIVALVISYVPYIARVVRSAALRERNIPYVAALTVQGLPAWVICVRHLLPNIRTVLLAQATLMFGYAMVDLAAISFLGLGVQPPQADWGLMVAEGQASVLRGYPQQSLYAGALIVIVVIAITLLGERWGSRTLEGRR